ncbi:Anti-sigma-K factor rskA [Nonomuraea solani]|uniref:Regulator of SigK n=1 Tax=Nonomuraea solani TaxID=1144553 RepID=A0A1H6EXW2_9ACTN|nr:anti-sigma factor [Nonomuraea solani]SEH02243.1 Anti-sigma-K factor rskA [Nonomuraea solani]
MNEELHTLSGAYAVHALPYAEWVLFEEHLLACPGCWIEVRRLRETAAKLAEAVAEAPPARLRGRLLAAAHQRRCPEDQVRDDSPTIWRPPQARPPVAPPPDAPTLGITPDRPEQPATLSLPPQASYRMAPGISVTPEDGAQVVPLRRGRSKLLAGMTAVAAAAAVVLGVVAFDARRDLGDLAGKNEDLVAVLAAPDAETVRQPVTSGGTGTIVISRAQRRMVFTSSGLPDLPDTEAYELWLMDEDGPRPAGLLDQRPDGLTTPMVMEPLDRDGHVAITVEPKNGSDTPTTQPIMLAELPKA